jgi:hypothetical protein
MYILSGVKTIGLMQTLMTQFPLVKTVTSGQADNPTYLAQPYLTWHLIAFDSQFNLLLAKYEANLADVPLADLVILVGAVAQAWRAFQQNCE